MAGGAVALSWSPSPVPGSFSSGRPCRCGPNGRGGGGGERDQVRAAGADEGQVEDVRVVDRVEGPLGEEGQVLAVER